MEMGVEMGSKARTSITETRTMTFLHPNSSLRLRPRLQPGLPVYQRRERPLVPNPPSMRCPTAGCWTNMAHGPHDGLPYP